MSRVESPPRRVPAALIAAALIAAAVVAGVGLPAPAAAVPVRHADAIGVLTIQPTSGTVDGNPMLVSATTPAPCPARYGAAAMLRVGPVGGPYSNIVRPGQAGDYDRAPFTMTANRSMTTSQGRVPAEGEYQVVVECVGADLGPHPDRFIASIVVRGNTWRVRDAAGAPAVPPARPPATGTPGGGTGPADPPATTEGTAVTGPPSSDTVPPGAPGPTGSASAGTRMASQPGRDGSALPWALGTAAIVLVAAGLAVPLIRRRRRVRP